MVSSLLLLPHPLRSTLTITSAPAAAAPRPAVILPGLGNNTADYQGLAATLRDGYGVPSVVARVSRPDWLRNAAGLLDANYWRGTLRPRPILDWYLERVEAAVAEAKQILPEGGKISLIGHSAGGWLARVYMDEFGTSDVSLLLTLGSPLLPPPKGLPGVIDQTRGLLDYVEKNCSPAVYTPELRYVCIAGRYIQGARLVGTPPSDVIPLVKEDQGVAGSFASKIVSESASVAPSLRARIIGQGYKQKGNQTSSVTSVGKHKSWSTSWSVLNHSCGGYSAAEMSLKSSVTHQLVYHHVGCLVCGRADVWGDGVVPEISAHLEGAVNISFDGVYHSPVGSQDAGRPWYGSPAIVERWVHHLLT